MLQTVTGKEMLHTVTGQEMLHTSTGDGPTMLHTSTGDGPTKKAPIISRVQADTIRSKENIQLRTTHEPVKGGLGVATSPTKRTEAQRLGHVQTEGQRLGFSRPEAERLGGTEKHILRTGNLL
jgi:hypothetical protein